jgi:hypothetical protein
MSQPVFRAWAFLTVKQTIRQQLEAAGHYAPEVNEAYATLQMQFFSTMASRLGITPTELYRRKNLKVGSEQGAAQDYAQALASHPPKGWKHSLDGADAARMWEGAESAKAVFWTDLKGKLEQDAPEISEYSHSIDQSEINHIRNRHGDAAVERSRNQLPVSAQDVAQIPEIVTNYDAVRTDLRGHHGEQMVAYAKRVNDGVLLYMESATKKRRNLGAVSMWKYPPTVDVKQILAEAISPDHYARSVVAAYGNDNTNGQELNQSAFNGPEVATTPLAQGVTEIEVDGAVRPALNSNGKPIHWSQEGVRNFWRWFGDSKVVDSQGRPLVVYHGTNADFSVFSKDHQRRDVQFKPGFFFTENAERAGLFGDTLMPVYLSARNDVVAKRRLGGEIDHIHKDDMWLVFDSSQIKSATGNNGQFNPLDANILHQRSVETRQSYEARIDALFAGEKAAGPNDGVRVLDSSDVLGLLGFGNGPVHLAEGKVIKSQDNHPQMTADVWKKIPQWLDDPAAVFDSDTVSGRLTMIAPELVGGDLVLLAIEPNASGTQVHILVNAYNKDGGHPPVGRWLREGKGYLVDQKKFPTVLSDSGLQLSSSAWQNKPGMRKILTEKNLAGYRKQHGLQQASQARGTFNPETLAMAFGPDADFSTFLHESGHFFLEVLADIASAPGAPQQIVDDMAAVLKWAGATREQWDQWQAEYRSTQVVPDGLRAVHEKWAESFEQYLFEGKAPTAELQPLFRRFRQFMLSVYQSLQRFLLGRDLQMNDEIRQVMDRLVATTDEIGKAEQTRALLPLFESQKTSGMHDWKIRQAVRARDAYRNYPACR